jgi:hypothetical protein
VNKAHVTKPLFETGHARRCWRACAALLALSCIQFAHALEGVVGNPADEYYDARSPQLPDDYPAKSYSPERMLGSLQQLADGPAPSRKQLEDEFGLRFVASPGESEFVARGRLPLGEMLSWYWGAPPKTSLTLHFDGRRSFDDSKRRRQSKIEMCVSSERLISALNEGWKRVEKRRGNFPVEVSYEKKTGEHRRWLAIDPIDLQGGCVRSLSVIYEMTPE